MNSSGLRHHLFRVVFWSLELIGGAELELIDVFCNLWHDGGAVGEALNGLTPLVPPIWLRFHHVIDMLKIDRTCIFQTTFDPLLVSPERLHSHLTINWFITVAGVKVVGVRHSQVVQLEVTLCLISLFLKEFSHFHVPFILFMNFFTQPLNCFLTSNLVLTVFFRNLSFPGVCS